MKYQIILSQTVVETATVVVEAEDDGEAEQKVLDMLDDAIRPDWDWKFTEVESDAEIIDIEELKSEGVALRIPEEFHP